MKKEENQIFIVNSKALAEIKRKGSHATVYPAMEPAADGWWKKVKTPAVRMGKPEKSTQNLFVPVNVKDITIWKSVEIEKDKSKEAIQIGLTQFLIFKSLTIKGGKISDTFEVWVLKKLGSVNSLPGWTSTFLPLMEIVMTAGMSTI